MEQDKDWWVPDHLHRQKNALVGHYRKEREPQDLSPICCTFEARWCELALLMHL